MTIIGHIEAKHCFSVLKKPSGYPLLFFVFIQN